MLLDLHFEHLPIEKDIHFNNSSQDCLSLRGNGNSFAEYLLMRGTNPTYLAVLVEVSEEKSNLFDCRATLNADVNC